MLRNNRFYILLTSVIISVLIYVWGQEVFQQSTLSIVRIAEIYGFLSIGFLYITFLCGPLCYLLPTLPFKKQYMHARRALGVSAFYFALLHSLYAFSGLGGITGLSFLNNIYLFAFLLGIIGLIILFLLAITSFDAVIKKLTFPRWKIIHRFVYFSGFIILIHVFLIGANFHNSTGWIPQMFFCALVVLLFLEANRFDTYIQKKFPNLPRMRIAVICLICFVISFYVYSFLQTDNSNTTSMDMTMPMSSDQHTK